MKQIHLLILFICRIQANCTDMSSLYLMEYASNTSSEVLDAIDDHLSKMDIQKCTLSKVPEDTYCGKKSTTCEIALHTEIAQRLSIPNLTNIPCSTWYDKQCSSASQILEAHRCESISVCGDCCIRSPYRIPWYSIVGMTVPTILGCILCSISLVYLCKN